MIEKAGHPHRATAGLGSHLQLRWFRGTDSRYRHLIPGTGTGFLGTTLTLKPCPRYLVRVSASTDPQYPFGRRADILATFIHILLSQGSHLEGPVSWLFVAFYRRATRPKTQESTATTTPYIFDHHPTLIQSVRCFLLVQTSDLHTYLNSSASSARPTLLTTSHQPTSTALGESNNHKRKDEKENTPLNHIVFLSSAHTLGVSGPVREENQKFACQIPSRLFL